MPASTSPTPPDASAPDVRGAPRLALFDLDHTLLPFDSGMRWADFLVDRGEVAADFGARYLAACQDYVAGRIDALGLHRVAASVFAGWSPRRVDELGRAFGAHIRSQVPAAAHALVARHRQAGALCCIVSATNRPVVEVFAKLLGIEAVCATELALRDGRYSGQVAGSLCHGAEKPRRVREWLHSLGLDWEAVTDSVFYSDAWSDLPLLAQCARAVAVSPDPTLRAHAEKAGWPIANTLADALTLA